MGDCDEGDVPYTGRYCKCGLKAGGVHQFCPDCRAPWPENLVQRAPHDGGPVIRHVAGHTNDSFPPTMCALCEVRPRRAGSTFCSDVCERDGAQQDMHDTVLGQAAQAAADALPVNPGPKSGEALAAAILALEGLDRTELLRVYRALGTYYDLAEPQSTRPRPTGAFR